MRRHQAILLSFALVTVGLAGAASAHDEDHLELRDRYSGDASGDAETTTYEFQVPSDAVFTFTVDWADDEVEVDVLEQPTSFHDGLPQASGCVHAAGGATPWAQPTVSALDCDYAKIGSSVGTTSVVCATNARNCWTDGLNFDWNNWGYFVVACDGTDADVVSWEEGTDAVTCDVSTIGPHPTTWDAYDSICGSAWGGNGLAGCLHLS